MLKCLVILCLFLTTNAFGFEDSMPISKRSSRHKSSSSSSHEHCRQCPTGPTGPTGPRGLNGLNGQNGLNGEIGPTGPVGQTGATGATGATGSFATAYRQAEGDNQLTEGTTALTFNAGTFGTPTIILEPNFQTFDLPTGGIFLVSYGATINPVGSGGEITSLTFFLVNPLTETRYPISDLELFNPITVELPISKTVIIQSTGQMQVIVSPTFLPAIPILIEEPWVSIVQLTP